MTRPHWKREIERWRLGGGGRAEERDAEAALELWDLDQSGFEVIPLPSYIKPFVVLK